VKEGLKIFQHFCGTHFLTPRYLKLFEIIPPATSQEYWTPYNTRREILGKQLLLLKTLLLSLEIVGFGIQSLFHLVKEMGLTIEEVDKLTGPVIGRPKSATLEQLMSLV
jgi:3-hydroxyacyl-CoA dehydrogenase